MAALIPAGSLLSWLVNRDAGPIAIASFIAFADGADDTLTYHAFAISVGSEDKRLNIVSAAVDSVVFPTLAFGGFLPLIVLGQFIAKVAGGAVWAALLRFGRR